MFRLLLLTLLTLLVAVACGKNDSSQGDYSALYSGALDQDSLNAKFEPLAESMKSAAKVNAALCRRDKVLVCHVPPGNPANAHTICIGAPAVAAHMKHHDDYLGVCGQGPSPSATPDPGQQPGTSPTPGGQQPGETPAPGPGETPAPGPGETPAPEVSPTPGQQPGETPAPGPGETASPTPWTGGSNNPSPTPDESTQGGVWQN